MINIFYILYLLYVIFIKDFFLLGLHKTTIH